MKTRVQELLQLGDRLYSKRFPLLTLWQSFAENFYPIRADMTRSRYISEEFASYLMTGRPVLAHRELANALSSILRPRGMDWFQPRTAIDSVNEDRACKEWLDRAGATMRRAMYDGASQFTPATKESDAHPFVRCVLDEDHTTILEEVSQFDLGYVIPRWVTIGGFSQYAYSPTAIVALPDARMLQQMTLTLIEIGQKIVDPPMIAVGDAIQGGTNLYAGAINWVDPDYDERTGEVLRPITLNGEGLQWGTEDEDKIERVINEAFFLNVLNLPEFDGKAMTAYEVSERMKEYIRRATPLFEPMDLEYNGRLCQATFDMLDRIGAFGSRLDRPPALRGQKIEFKFANPLVQAEAEARTASFTKMAQLLGAVMQFDPSERADINFDKAFRGVYERTGAPAEWLEEEEKAAATKAQAGAQQAALKQGAALGPASEQAGKAATAVKNVAEMASSLPTSDLC